MSDDQVMCTCMRVTYNPEPVGDRMRERWSCTQCGALFMRERSGTRDQAERIAELEAELKICRTENEDVRNDYRQWRETSTRLMEKQDQRIAELEAERDKYARLHSEAEGQIACRNEMKARTAELERELSIAVGALAEFREMYNAREQQLAEMRTKIEAMGAIYWADRPYMHRRALILLLDEYDIPKREASNE